jgi:hypothetical protein
MTRGLEKFAIEIEDAKTGKRFVFHAEAPRVVLRAFGQSSAGIETLDLGSMRALIIIALIVVLAGCQRPHRFDRQQQDACLEECRP